MDADLRKKIEEAIRDGGELTEKEKMLLELIELTEEQIKLMQEMFEEEKRISKRKWAEIQKILDS